MTPSNAPSGRDRDEGTSSIPREGRYLRDGSAWPNVDAELHAAMNPPRSPRGTEGNSRPELRDAVGQGTMIAAGEDYAKRFREHPKEQQQWTESAPPPIRALFLAIRENTPEARVRDSDGRAPYHHDATRPRLGDLSDDLRELLEMSWPAWDKLE